MSELQGHPGHLSPEDGLARLAALWGEPDDSPEQRRADAWARRALGLEAEPGDAAPLAEVDAELADKYGLRRVS